MTETEANIIIASMQTEIDALRKHCHELHDEKVRLEGMLAELQTKVKYHLPNLSEPIELPKGNTTITRG